MHWAVELGMMHRFIGLIAVIMVILLQLIVFAGVFVVLRDRPAVFRLRVSRATAVSSSQVYNASPAFASALLSEIGRASCRERVCQYVYISVVDVTSKEKKRSTHIKSR